jgi:prolyl-tRNA synthetase
MKDLYSFHLSDAELDEYYESVCRAYTRVFDRCGIGKHTVRTFASGGVFSRFSDEFQLLHDSGEDTILVTEDGQTAVNTEISQDSEALRIVFGDKTPALIERRAIEVGNTFKLGTRYTDALGLRVQDHTGDVTSVRMCSYGLGTTRLLAAIAEVYGDENGLVWPQAVAPYDLHIVRIGDAGRSSEQIEQITRLCTDQRISALLDLREEVRPGEKFFTADRIGIPLRVVVGGTRAAAHTVEVKERLSGTTYDVPCAELVGLVKKR